MSGVYEKQESIDHKNYDRQIDRNLLILLKHTLDYLFECIHVYAFENAHNNIFINVYVLNKIYF